MKKNLAAVAIVSLVSCFAARAATIEWNNTGPDWAIGSDWVGGTAPADSTVTDIAAFGATGSPQVNPVLNAARSINGVTFLANAYSYTISGSALTIGSGGIGSGAIFATETFSNTVKTSITQQWTNAGTLTLSGTLDLNSDSATARTLTLNGAGTTFFNGVVQNSFAGSTGNLTYSGDPNGSLTLANANTYNGLTTITSGALFGMHDMAFGSSNVSLTGNTAMLTLSSGLLNDYINNSATLSTSNGATIALNYATTDIVGAFVVNGVPQPAGVYNAINEPGLLFGTGSITVVPEPAVGTSIILGAGLLIGLQWLLRRRNA
jgi:autotransporter-associated beta strand protein